MDNVCNKMDQYEKAIEKAWNYTFDRLYYPKTHMIYDFLMGESIEATLDEYPTAEEIAASSPNPCGWGTGMEDSTLSICPMLEAILARYQVTGEPEMKQYADMMYEGLKINGTIAPEPGFIARCVSPIDGKSIYMDSSRDQYTNWIFGAHLLLHSELAEEAQKEVLRKVLVQVAQKAERDVDPSTGGYLFRLDQKPGIVSQMNSDNLGGHEFLRLPMIYLAAYEASGDSHWQEKYLECREEILQKAEKKLTREFITFVANDFGYVYGFYQSQYSVRLLYDCETDPAYRQRYEKLMQDTAECCEIYMKAAYEKIDTLAVAEPIHKPWRELPAGSYRFFHGYAYYVPAEYDQISEDIKKYLRNVAETVIIQCLCPDYKIPEWEKSIFCEFVEKVKFDQATSYWPLLFCDAWWLMKKTGQI